MLQGLFNGAAGLGFPFARLTPSTETRRVMRALWPYIWPRDRRDLQRTVVASLVLIVIAKAVTVGVA